MAGPRPRVRRSSGPLSQRERGTTSRSMVANSMRQEAEPSMTTPPGPASFYRRGLAAVTTLLLALAALVYLGYHLAIAFDPDDTNHLETPLAMAAANQLIEGPGALYGPFSARRPLVLI